MEAQVKIDRKQTKLDEAASALAWIADNDVSSVAPWLAYLAEAIEEELGEGWLYDLETMIRERRERGGW